MFDSTPASQLSLFGSNTLVEPPRCVSLGRRRWWLVGLLLFAGMASDPRVVWGELPRTHTIGVYNPKNMPPWSVTVIDAWVDGNGYRPVQFDVRPLPPIVVPTRRSYLVEVEFTPHSWSTGERTTLRHTFEIPAGSNGVSETVLVPVPGSCDAFDFRISVDGYRIREFAETVVVGNGGVAWNDETPRILVLDSDAPPRLQRLSQVALSPSDTTELPARKLPDVSLLGTVVGATQFAGLWNNVIVPPAPGVTVNRADIMNSAAVSDLGILALMRVCSHMMMAPPSDLDSHWLTLSSFDIVVISLEDLKKLAEQDADRFQALLDWTATGPALCVYGVGDKFERLAELEKQLKLRPVNSDAVPPRGWMVPTKDMYLRTYPSLKRAARASMYAPGATFSAPMPVAPGPIDAFAEPASKTGTSTPLPLFSPEQIAEQQRNPWIRARSYEMGQVVAIGPENPFPGTESHWNLLLAMIGDGRWRWVERHGISTVEENPTWSLFTIANVGNPPLFTFLGLISVFAMVIGPVNYVWLHRRGRLYLLLVTVPVGAGLVSTLLLVYAIVADGLHTRARIRSFTYLNQAQGHAVHWSRQTFYAGMAPGRGLQYPDDTAVYPVRRWGMDEQNAQRRMSWNDDHQQLARGFLPSRDMAQFLTVRSHASKAALVFGRHPAAEQPYPVENQLGAKVALVVARDDEGNYFWGESLAPGDKGQLLPISLNDAALKLRSVNDQRIYDVSRVVYDEAPPRWGRRRYYRPMAAQGTNFLANGVATQGLLDQNLGRWRIDSEKLAPREYVAFIDRLPDVSVGGIKVVEEGSVHLIVGTW